MHESTAGFCCDYHRMVTTKPSGTLSLIKINAENSLGRNCRFKLVQYCTQGYCLSISRYELAVHQLVP